MNIYLVVEGEAEKKIYPKWVKYINPSFRIIDDFQDVIDNCIYIVSGMGYPYYFEIIKAGAQDVANNPNFNLLVIAIDSEEMSYDEKRDEISRFIDRLNLNIEYRIIIQHFCFETWALGNQYIIKRHSSNTQITKYRDHFDVLTKDPELLLPPRDENTNRAQFAYKYLRALLNDKSDKLHYSKRNPDAVLNRGFFSKVKRRYKETGHINSFKDFLIGFL